MGVVINLALYRANAEYYKFRERALEYARVYHYAYAEGDLETAQHHLALSESYTWPAVACASLYNALLLDRAA